MRNTSVEAYIRAYEIEDGKHIPIVGPQKAVESHCSKALKLVPGRDRKSDIAKTVQSRLNESLDLDYIIRSLPPGKSNIES